MYAAVLSSLLMPAGCITFGMTIKYAVLTLKADPMDFTLGYFLLMNFVSQIAAIFYFSLNPGTFNMKYWIPGTIGSAINVLGCMLMNIAVSTG